MTKHQQKTQYVFCSMFLYMKLHFLRTFFLLNVDSCSFHTYDYARHFVSACTRILGLEGTPEGVEDEQGRLTRVAAVCSSVFFFFFLLMSSLIK